MGRYVIRRLIMTVFVIVGAAIVIFLVLNLVPGDPAKLILGNDATYEQIEAKRAQLGLDKPVIVQLANFLYNAFIKFDLGKSWFKSIDVTDGLWDRIPRTVTLGLITMLINTFVGIPIGISAAYHRNSLGDRGLMIAAMVFMAVPNFYLALLLILLFSVKLDWLPSYGIESWKCYILPILSGTIGGFCGQARQTRVLVLDIMNSDYITTARAKGLKESVIKWKHLIPNAMIPILTGLGGGLAGLLGGSIVTEQIFSFPGVGLYLTDGISNRDYPIIRGCVVIIAAFTAIVMLLVDIAYAYVDPRIKAQYINSSRKKGKIRV